MNLSLCLFCSVCYEKQCNNCMYMHIGICIAASSLHETHTARCSLYNVRLHAVWLALAIVYTIRQCTLLESYFHASLTRMDSCLIQPMVYSMVTDHLHTGLAWGEFQNTKNMIMMKQFWLISNAYGGCRTSWYQLDNNTMPVYWQGCEALPQNQTTNSFHIGRVFTHPGTLQYRCGNICGLPTCLRCYTCQILSLVDFGWWPTTSSTSMLHFSSSLDLNFNVNSLCFLGKPWNWKVDFKNFGAVHFS